MKIGRKKGQIIGIAAALLAAGILAGCGVSSGGSTSQAAGEAGSTAENTAEDTARTADSAAAEKTVIHAATGGSPAPYISVDENNVPQGYDIEVLRAVFDRLPQYELQLDVVDGSSAALTGLGSGLYDIAVNNFGYRPERAESYYYSYPYDKIKYVFIQRKDDTPLTSLQDAADRGYKIEAGAGNNITNALEQWNAENPDHQIQIIYTESDLAVTFQHVEDGVSDFRIDDLPIYTAYQKEYGFEGLQGNELSQEESDRISSSLNSYFLLPKTEAGAALREDVDTALKELREDGTLAELSQKFFNGDQVPDEVDFEQTLN